MGTLRSILCSIVEETPAPKMNSRTIAATITAIQIGVNGCRCIQDAVHVNTRSRPWFHHRRWSFVQRASILTAEPELRLWSLNWHAADMVIALGHKIGMRMFLY